MPAVAKAGAGKARIRVATDAASKFSAFFKTNTAAAPWGLETSADEAWAKAAP